MSEHEGAVVLVVRNIEPARRWYGFVFNYRVASERVGLNGVPIEASLRRPGGPSLVLLSAQHEASSRPRQTVLRLVVRDSLDDLAERAAALDEGSSAPLREDTEFGPQLRLEDPDGHILVVLNADSDSG